MVARVILRSRSGNVVLAVLGGLYVLGALTVLVALAIEVWNAAGLTDRALLLGLVAAAACGIWFLETALENLGVRIGRGMHFMHRSTGSH